MTEIPEHLLKRSKSRRSALGLGSDEGGIAEAAAPRPAAEVEVPGGADAAAPAKGRAAKAAPTPAPAAPIKPIPPYVAAGVARKKIPVWAVPVLLLLPIWAIVYAGTLDKETSKVEGPRALGAEVYNTQGCAGCHGGGGGGGSGPALTSLGKDFPKASDQLFWIMEGTAGFKAKGIATYGANKPVGSGGVMPGWAANLTAEQLIGVSRHEREAFAGATFEPTEYDEMLTMIQKEFPDREAEFKDAIDLFKTMDPSA